jgi:hypothetical protein
MTNPNDHIQMGDVFVSDLSRKRTNEGAVYLESTDNIAVLGGNPGDTLPIRIISVASGDGDSPAVPADKTSISNDTEYTEITTECLRESCSETVYLPEKYEENTIFCSLDCLLNARNNNTIQQSQEVLERQTRVSSGEAPESSDNTETATKFSQDDAATQEASPTTHPTTPNSTPDSGNLEDLRKDAEADTEPNPDHTTTTSSNTTAQYNRSEAIRDYVMARAAGVCEGCGNEAPYLGKDGEPYLHAHHVYELSEGGSDAPDTVIALCPNCHYRVHHGQDGEEYNEYLIDRLADIEPPSE